MAVAPVALEMGPRNTRRLTTSAAVIAGAVAIAGFALWFFGGPAFVHSTHQSRSAYRAPALGLIPNQAGLPYGMTKQQMIHRLGRPEKVAGKCLQYPEGITTSDRRTINAVRMCFSAGQYQTWFIEIGGKWNMPGLFKRVMPGNPAGPFGRISPPTNVTPSPLNRAIPDWSKRPHESSR